ncbi:AI-2E family transporter [Oscillatoria amoena NRMC-F 0135]|nr:AI-2E family transporter [Oscillatoria amoena NRMC-F 0135]
MEAGTTSGFRVERAAAWLVILGIVVFSLVYFSSFLQPIVIAGMIWYAVYELKRFFGKIKIRERTLPSWIRTVMAFMLILLISVGIYEIITLNLELIIEKSPVYASNFRSMVTNLRTLEGFRFIQERAINSIAEFNIQPVLTSLLNSLTNIAGNIFIIIIYIAFLLVEERYFDKKLKLWVKDPLRQEKITGVINQIADATRKYVSVKTQMSLLTGLLSYFILLGFGIDFPVWWAFLIFLLNFIPYIGSFFATLLPAAFAMFQFQSFLIFLWLFVAIQAVQFGVGNVLEPKIMGRTLNLSPLGVLLALTFWGIIWGILGMILSVPITSVMVIVCAQFEQTKFLSIWLSETGEIDPS